MPITTDPTEVTITQEAILTTNALRIMQFVINGTDLSTESASASTVLRPYHQDGNGPITYAGQDTEEHIATADVKAAAAQLASRGKFKLAQLFDQVFQCISEIRDDKIEAKAALDAFTTAQATAQTALDEATTTVSERQRELAAVSPQLFLGSPSPELTDEQKQAVETARAALASAQQDMETARAALTVAQEKVKVATMAWQDAANPRAV